MTAPNKDHEYMTFITPFRFIGWIKLTAVSHTWYPAISLILLLVIHWSAVHVFTFIVVIIPINIAALIPSWKRGDNDSCI